MLRYCVYLKAIRYESTTLNRIVADKSHRVIVALGVPVKVRFFKLTISGNCIIRKTCCIVFNLKRKVR